MTRQASDRAESAGVETPREAAARWLALKRSGRMTTQDARAFAVWRAADPKNAAALDSMERTWRAYGEILEDPEVMEVREWALSAFNRPARARLVGAVAASAALIGFAGWAATKAGLFGEIALFAPPESQEFRTGVGQTTTAALPDGSIVTLDTDTVLKAQLSGAKRLIILEKGKAFFRVAKDRSRPFVVNADGRTVTATGTAFEVRQDTDRFEVTLIEGRVRVEAAKGQSWQGQKKADMRAGWRLVAHDDKRWEVTPVDVNKETSWLSGRLTFFNDPLGEAAAEMNRYSERQIVVAPEIAHIGIVGVFPIGDVEAFVETAEATKLARVTQSDDAQIVIGPRGK